MRLLFPAALSAAIVLSAPAFAADPLVTADWLDANRTKADVVVLDIRSEGLTAFVPGAVHSDYAKAGWRTTVNGTVGMLPPPADLEKLIGGLGIDNNDHVIVVPAGLNATDFGGATRVYWTFKVLGHDEVSILDGGFAKWQEAGKPTESAPASRPAATFAANFRPQLVASVDDVLKAAASGKVPLVDARPADQFTGAVKPPVAQAAGTIPGAVNLENHALYDAQAKSFAQGDLVKQLAGKVGLEGSGEQIAFCNTGHWASVAWFALSEVMGNKDVKLYDGSMAEYTADPSRPIVKTAAQ